ncbi:MAG: DNA recombination protein RmuC [Parvularculaceae bacterium]
MQTQTPAGAPPAEPAQPAGGTLQPSGGGAADGIATVGLATFAVFAAVFLFVLFVIMAARMGGRRKADAPVKSNEGGDFFQPAGDDAEITFEDGTTVVAAAEADTPKPRKNSLFGFGKKEARPEPAEVISAPEAVPEAEIVIERAAPAEEVNIPAPRPRKPAPFANLFGKKKKLEEALPPAPPANDETVVEIIPAAEEYESAPAASAGKLSRSVFAAARTEDDDWRRRLEDERQAVAERADEERRLAAEEDLRRDFERRAQAEREAEFERRKLSASLDHRMQELEARERALKDRELSSTLDAGAVRGDLQREIDARFAELSQRYERAPRAAQPPPADATALLRDLDQRITRLAERDTRAAGAIGESSYPDERSGQVGEISRRMAEHRDAINSSLEQMQSRIDLIAGAPQDVRALREEIASLKRALGERVSGPNAPTVQLSDIVRNALPPDAFEMRAMLPNNRKADCLVRLPHPPGPIAIDARFPVEAFSKLHQAPDADPRAENDFRRVALRHIVDIAERLIVPDETADSALMFISSETMYAELHARFPDVVQDSFRARVWIVSPTTLMATLHTMRAVLRDAYARQNTELIQAEAGHVLSEVEALRRRVVALEDNFNRVREDFRGLVSSTDQVYRRAETISNTRRAITDDTPRRFAGREEAPPPPEPRGGPEASSARSAPIAPAAQTGDLWEERSVEETRQPFPLR